MRQQRAQALAEKERRRVALLAEKKEKGVQQADDFRARMRRQQLAREMERDVDKAQRACRQLDSAEVRRCISPNSARPLRGLRVTSSFLPAGLRKRLL